MVTLFPDQSAVAEDLADAQWELDGDTAAWTRRMRGLPRPAEDAFGLRPAYLVALYSGNAVEADRILADARMPPAIDWYTTVIKDPVALHQALVAFLRGDRARAQERADATIAYFRAGDWAPRQETSVMLGTALVHALAGRGEEAVRLARAGVSQAKSQDAFEAIHKVVMLGQIYAALDRRDEAFAVLHELMTGPSLRHFGSQYVRHDPLWSRLKDDPRFEEILQRAKPL
jgi:tetratricopeptide (TPR) repeat protein